METQVRTPQMVFMQPQRLIVPLFQRPYVWNEENQWEPLWNDVVRVAERLLKQPQRAAPAALPRRRRAAAGAEPDRADAEADDHRWSAAADDAAASCWMPCTRSCCRSEPLQPAAADRAAGHERRSRSAQSPRTSSRSGRRIATGRRSTPSWAPSRPWTTTRSAIAASGWSRRIGSSANRRASG